MTLDKSPYESFLMPGDWFGISLNETRYCFYAKQILQDGVVVGCARWQSSLNHKFTFNQLQSYCNRGKYHYLGHTRKRHWVKFVPWPFNDLICPYKIPKIVRENNADILF